MWEIWVHKGRKAVAVIYNDTLEQVLADHAGWRKKNLLDTSYWEVVELWEDDHLPPTLDHAPYKKYEN